MSGEHLIEAIAYDWIAEEIPLGSIRKAIGQFNADQAQQFYQSLPNSPIKPLIRRRSNFFDRLLSLIWQRLIHKANYCLIAVGGYGRRELFPHSDIDLLIVCEDFDAAEKDQKISLFIRSLWDMGVQVGSSVRDLGHCQQSVRKDMNFATSLLESHLVAGSWRLFVHFRKLTRPNSIIQSSHFYQAKIKEQTVRHRRNKETAFNLEPNVKEGAGGLRDFHMIMWIAKFHFPTSDAADLSRNGYLTNSEYRQLDRSRSLLWKIRFALHLHCQHDENRMLLQYQAHLATLFGYQDSPSNLASEHFMRRYYRTVRNIFVLNALIFQHFNDNILRDGEIQHIHPINARFQIRRDCIETRHARVFEYAKFSLLEIFLLMQQHGIARIGTRTVREMHASLVHIDDRFRQESRHQKLFIQILAQPVGVTRVLRIMHDYGLLAAYIPTFAKVQGLMQFDLFHEYTVDAHSIMTVRNLRRLMLPQFAGEKEHARNVAATIKRPELLYLAALFHDIAKGRGGRHEILGAYEMEAFCDHHDFNRRDTRLCKWLVQNHLIFSMTAQKRDLNDQRVIKAFSEMIPSLTCLDMLYLLSVADVQATSAKLWNGYKSKLYESLWRKCRDWMENHKTLDDEASLVRNTRSAARIMIGRTMRDDSVQLIWQRFPDSYFLNHRADQISWHTGNLKADVAQKAVACRCDRPQSTTELMVYYPRAAYQFACLVNTISGAGYNIAQATIIRTPEHFALTTFTLPGDSVDDLPNDKARRALCALIRHELNHLMKHGPTNFALPRRISDRRAHHIAVRTVIRFVQDEERNATDLHIRCRDRPGLLSLIVFQLTRLHLLVIGARVNTVGARAEDIFTITDTDYQPITGDARQSQIRNLIYDQINRQ